ncbi:unnamed protein product [Adineta steineri]|uniref:RING-type domain-containing protein n=1 Tax=Adineta steineri TaxID=433720 RepID=A0A820D4Y3_9BILA|nr:unnamed protein product [Adineta steineri]CAF4226695.1 unnamed protein product [Adineta steineri]
MALVNALHPNQSDTKEECSICEAFMQSEEDLVTTSCRHTFHRVCAEKRVNENNRSDCRVCRAPDALSNALRLGTCTQGTCSICEMTFNPKPDLVITSCGHRFHRTCAENRVNERNRPECRACQTPMALTDALVSNQSSIGEECSICETVMRAEEDLVTTSCRHTFHRKCAEARLKEKNRSDCRLCQKPDAIANALHPNEASIEGECLICEDPLNHLVTTSCRHTFHHVCARKRLNRDKMTDCHVCHKVGALAEALSEKPKTTAPSDARRTSMETQPEQNVSVAC